MREGAVQYLAQVLRGLSGGEEPTRLVQEALAGAVAAVGGRHGVIVGRVDATSGPVAALGTSPRVVMETAADCMRDGRAARRRDAATGGGAVAHPIRLGQRVVGAISVGGDPVLLDAAPLSLFADAAGVALSRRAPATSASISDFSDAMTSIAADLDQTGVLSRAFDVATRLLGALGGFCVVPDGAGWRVAHYRWIAPAALRTAAAHPEFRGFVGGDALRVFPSTHAIVRALAEGAPAAVSAPLVAGTARQGFLVLLLGENPDGPARALIGAFADQLATILRSGDYAQQVRDHEHRLASLVHTSPAPTLLVDERGNFVLVNSAAAELLHLPEAFVAGQPAAGRLGHAALEELVGADRDGTAELMLGTPPDRLHRATVRVVRGTGGRDLGRVLVLDDLSSERETDQMKNDFVAVIGHELRTPLTVVKGYVKMLERKRAALDAATLDSCLGALTSNTTKLERLIEDLLFVSSIESRHPTLDLEPVDVATLVNGFAGNRVIAKCPRRPVPASIDRSKFAQIVHHLLDNALKYSEGEVVVEVVDGDDEVEIRVDDTGPGIYSGDLPHLFERFRQLDGSATRAQGGTGVGLYICRRLVELQGGRIRCESRLGVGSRFAFTLPKEPPVRAPAA